MELSPFAWAAFLGIVIVLLLLDLLVFHRRSHSIKMKEAVKWSVFWIALGLSFTAVVYYLYLTHPLGGPAAANTAVQTYLTGYVLEKALSVDNLFVFVILLSFFGVKPEHQHKVLFYGILGALIMRGIFIFGGTAAIHAYEPTLYFFGALLIYTAIKMAVMGEEEFDPSDSRIYRWLKRALPLTDKPHHGKFWLIENGRRLGTSLLLCVFMVELTDVLFALDSVPAVLGVTTDAFIVYTSNVFAILGLRALYFVIVGGLATLRFLKPALVVVLLFIGVKMIIGGPPIPGVPLPHYEVPVEWSLLIVIAILGSAVLASWLYEHHRRGQERVERMGRKIAEDAESTPNGDAGSGSSAPGPAEEEVPPAPSAQRAIPPGAEAPREGDSSK